MYHNTNMAGLAQITTLIVGTVGIVVVAAVIASTNSDIGSTAWTVLGFVTVGMAVGLLVMAFKS